MKIILLSVILLVLGAFLGYFFKAYRSPVFSETSSTYTCVSLPENSEDYKKILDANIEINKRMRNATSEFCSKHDIYESDFRAQFIPEGYFDYTIKYYCSNRSAKVYNLSSAYSELVSSVVSSEGKVFYWSTDKDTLPE